MHRESNYGQFVPSLHLTVSKDTSLPMEAMSSPLEFPQLDAIQIKKGIADCNAHKKNNHRFHSWKRKSEYNILILAIVCVHFTSKTEIFKKIVDKYNYHLVKVFIPVVYTSRFHNKNKIIHAYITSHYFCLTLLVFDMIGHHHHHHHHHQSSLAKSRSTQPLNPFTPKSDFIDFTLSNARRFYSSKGNPLGVKGLKKLSSLTFSLPRVT